MKCTILFAAHMSMRSITTFVFAGTNCAQPVPHRQPDARQPSSKRLDSTGQAVQHDGANY